MPAPNERLHRSNDRTLGLLTCEGSQSQIAHRLNQRQSQQDAHQKEAFRGASLNWRGSVSEISRIQPMRRSSSQASGIDETDTPRSG